MQRQVMATGLEPVVVTSDPAIAAASDRTFSPSARQWTCETLLSSSGLWGCERTIVLLGDVAYSSACMATILRCEQSVAFFVKRKGLSREIVALSFSGASSSLVQDAAHRAVVAAEVRREARLAHLIPELPQGSFACVRVTDWTQDFDTTDDWDGFDQSVVDDRPDAP